MEKARNMRKNKRTFAALLGMGEKAKIFSYAAKKAEAKARENVHGKFVEVKTGAKIDPPDASESLDKTKQIVSNL